MVRIQSPPPDPNLAAILPPFPALAIVASLAIIATFCTFCYPTTGQPPSPKNKAKANETMLRADTMDPPTMESIDRDDRINLEADDYAESSTEEKETITDLEAEIHGPIYGSVAPAISKSKRGLSMSLSIGFPEGLSRIMTSRRERQKEDEDTLWKKTIIMGEKNSAPDDEAEEGGGKESAAAIVGSCRRNYRPRSSSVSRNSSFADSSRPPATL